MVYKRVSTDQQSTDRQNLVLAEAGIEDPTPFEEDAGTSSRLHPLERPKFGELLTYARPGDTVHISEMFRLVRGTGHILDVLDVLRSAVCGEAVRPVPAMPGHWRDRALPEGTDVPTLPRPEAPTTRRPARFSGGLRHAVRRSPHGTGACQ
nr:recombinase family protein [Streptomyces cupreus]